MVKLLLRVAAVGLLSVAITPWFAPTHDRVLVLGLDGADSELLGSLIDQGKLPTLARILRTGVAVEVLGGDSRARQQTWRSLLAEPSAGRNGLTFLWDGVERDGGSAVVVNVPGVDQRLLATGLVLPGPRPSDGFIGDSTGAVANLVALAGAEVPWPYSLAASQVQAWAKRLKPGERSPWISVRLSWPQDLRGIFRIYGIDASVAYLTPVYRRTLETMAGVEMDGRVYVADEPSWTASSSRLRDYYYRHVRDLSADRAELAAAVERSPWRLFVYVETSLLGADFVYSSDSAAGMEGARAGELLSQAYSEVDRRFSKLIARAGRGTLVVLLMTVARAPDHGGSFGHSEASGYFVVSNGRGRGEKTSAGIEQVVPTLKLLLGGSQGSGSRGPVPAVVRRFWRLPLPALARRVAVAGKAEAPVDASALRALGLATGVAEIR